MKFLLFLLLLELSLFASIGKISALNGKIVVDRQKQLLDAVVGFDLEEKDLVITDDKSKAQITLNDGTVLSLGKNSKLDINEYVYDEKDSSNSKANFKFAEGTFKSITGAIGKVAPEKFKLETKSASIGIRGTIVVGNQEKVACTHGRIAVTSAGVTQLLNAGMMTNTESGKAPTPPTKIEGNLLKEVELDSGSKKEESKSTTNEVKKTENASDVKTTPLNATEQNSIATTSFNDISSSINNTTSDTIALLAAAEAKKKADAVAFAAEEVRKKALAIQVASEAASTAATAATTAATAASTASEAAIKALAISQAASTAAQAEANEAYLAAQSAAQIAAEASIQAANASVTATNALTTTVNALTSDLAQSSSLEASSTATTASTFASTASTAALTAVNQSKIITNIPFYKTNVDINSSQNVGSKIFTVPTGGATVTIATYGIGEEIDPVIILLKKNADGNYVYVNRNDDNWIKSGSYYNSVLNLPLEEGVYKIAVSDFPFSDQEAINGQNNGNVSHGNIELYFSSTKSLSFDDSSIQNYSYSNRKNNLAYVQNNVSSTLIIEENKAEFGALANSAVGTSVIIKNLDKNYNGAFVTISDSFLSTTPNNVFLNTNEIDDGSSWGYWTNNLTALSTIRDLKSTWVSGNQVTPPNNYKATLQGQVIGSVTDGNDSGYIKLDNNNLFKATIDIGASTITNSLIQFKESLSNNLWTGTFNTSGPANVNPQGFSSSIVNTDNVSIGSLSGKYYGTNGIVKSIGGGFNITNGGATTNGVFKARETSSPSVPSLSISGGNN